MKITLTHQGRHIEMLVAQSDITEDWGYGIDDITADLDHRKGVKRMSYDTWHWDERRHVEAEEYITYFYLKHG